MTRSPMVPPLREVSLSLACGLWAALSLATPATAAAGQQDELAAKARQGNEAMAAGRFEEAASLYAAIVEALPKEPGMRMNLGMALSMAGRPQEAVPHLERALTLKPDLLPASLFLGSSYLELGQPAKAAPALRKFVTAHADHREARRMLADAELSLERFEAAAREYRVLAEQDPQDARAWHGLGRSYEGLSRLALLALQRESPESGYLSLLVAGALVAQERDKSAFPLYREAIARKTGVAEAHEALAGIYERSGHEDWAAVERQKAKAVPPPACRTATAECEFRAGRHARVLEVSRSPATAASRYWTARAAGELAREAFARLESLPPSAEASLVRAETLRTQRRYAQCKEELQKAASAWPGDRRIRRELASLLFIAHEHEEARPLLEELLKQEPDAADLNLVLGECWLESKQPARAAPFLEKAVSADPKLLPARGALGRAYVESGRPAEAIPHLEAALPTDEDGSLHFQLARAYRETGQQEAATRTLGAVQDMRRANEARQQAEKEEFTITPP